MLRAQARPARGLRFGICVLAAAVAVATFSSDSADARRRYKRTYHKFSAHKVHRAHTSHYSPPQASIVIDVNSGQTLHANNADSLRHPASLTKIMTLYLLFEQLEAGKLKLDSRLSVSEHASAQAPTKLGLRPGQTIEVEDAIKALVTK